MVPEGATILTQGPLLTFDTPPEPGTIHCIKLTIFKFQPFLLELLSVSGPV